MLGRSNNNNFKYIYELEVIHPLLLNPPVLNATTYVFNIQLCHLNLVFTTINGFFYSRRPLKRARCGRYLGHARFYQSANQM